MIPITINNSNTSLIDSRSQAAINILTSVGLPTDNIIADPEQRNIVEQNLPTYLNSLPLEIKREARYLSKFVLGAASGLFDYSLNAIWNEVVLVLRKKAISYGIDIFFDAAVGGGANRDFYKKDEDLIYLKDAVLLDTSKKLELISDHTYKRLKHILDMRNDIGISHPNDHSIGGFELLHWLDICINNVLKDQPTEAAIHVQEFISNLKEYKNPLDEIKLENIKRKLKSIPTYHLSNILRTVFGIYVAEDTHVEVRSNIAKFAPDLWSSCLDEPKYKLGIILEGYNTNLKEKKYKLGEEFFNIVDGNSYKSINEKTIIVDKLLDELQEKHNGWDNFHHEVPIADSLASYIKEHDDIISNNVEKMTRVILICRIGKGTGYCSGVSQRGKKYYDHILSKLSDKYAPYAITSLTHYEIQRKLTEKVICRKQAKESLLVIRSNISQPRLIECFDYLIERIENNALCVLDKEFKTLSSSFIRWG